MIYNGSNKRVVMNKRYSLATCLSLGVIGTINVATCATNKTNQPNVLFLLVDDMGWKDTGYTGSDFYETPTIDSLASVSMRFSDGYACAGNSAPSRACLLSGQYTPRHQIFAVTSTNRGPKEQMRLSPYPNNPNLPLECYTIAEALRDAGYRTALSGKWHLGERAPFTPTNQGFDHSYADKIDNKIKVSDDPKNMFSEVSSIMTFIEQSVKDNKPFFAYLPFHAVHKTWQAREDYINYFKAKRKGVQHNQVVYAAMIKHLDDAVRILITKLKDLGVDNNTLIVFTSDNGGVPETPQTPLRASKGTLYEGGIRVPMFFHLPNRIKSGDCNIPVSNVDFYPTLLEFANSKAAEDKVLDGESLLPLLVGERLDLNRKSLFWHFPGYLNLPCPDARDTIFRQRPVSVIRKGDWKLLLFWEEWLLDGGMENIEHNNSVELYNLHSDIGEKSNLAGKNRVTRDELLNDLLLWIKKSKAPLSSVPK